MSKKNFIRLNINDNYLSLGNLFRIIKEESNSKNTFLQSDLFCTIFNIDSIADSTVNNYCTGFRAINSSYKAYFQKLKKDYEIDNLVLKSTIIHILSLLENVNLKEDISLESINNNVKLYHICNRLYSISKNDSDVNINLSDKLHNFIESQDLYNFLVQVLFYVILDKKQPILIDESFSNIVEKNIYDTNISLNDITDFINIQLNSGIWSIRGINELAKTHNPFACFEMASLEFYGLIAGYPRYDKAYEYYRIAADNKHPTANWAIGYMYYTGKIGSNTKHDKYLSLKYLNKARKLKCSNAFNSLGLIILNGNFPHIPSNKEKAIEFFKEAASLGNVYAFNNLGKIYEKENKLSIAFSYYQTAANIGESWAANKVGEFYRQGIYVNKDLSKAYEYYKKASDSPIFTLCEWSKYNLAKYFYLYGNLEIGINKDINKAISLLDSITDNIKALEELIYIYYNLYIESKKENKDYLNKLHYYINLIGNHTEYSVELKNKIENKLKDLNSKITKIELPL